jgi:putative CocE/NonD family hydrolase
MKKKIGVNKMLALIIVFVLLGALAFSLYPRQASRGAVSEFGVYRGYMPQTYDGYQRVSDYMTLSDGTRVAYDLILPTKNGVPADKPLPVLFKYTPYMRAWTVYDKSGKSNVAELEALAWYEEGFLRLRSWLVPNGNILDPMWRTKWLGSLVKSGYGVVVAERPGTGASFGQYDASNAAMAREADDILNWIAAQAWCDGNIGMYGDSVQGQVQLAAASTGNPHLKALFVESTWMDVYQSFMYPGGIYDKSFGDFYVWSQKLLDSAMITPVDRDTDGALLAQARAERRSGMTAVKLGTSLAAYPFKDSLTSSGKRYWDNAALYPLLDRINQAGVPVYLINGWYDPLARENFLIYANLTAPKRMLVRAADHSQADDPGGDVDYAAEAQRWFDTWLKGVDNGIMQEPPIHYYLQGAGHSQAAWQVADVWPPQDGAMTRYYFGAGAAPRAGALVPTSPAAGEAADAYTVDYTTTTGLKARWTAVNWAHEYPNMRANDAKALTYTTPPLEAAAQIVGHPVVHLWLSTDASDLDVFAYLEEVDGSGNSTYITEGMLRASHRVTAPAPYENLGLPYRNHFQSEVEPLPAGEPVELVFDLLPTAYRFGAGKQLRVTVAFADADNFDTPVLSPAPALQLLRSGKQASYVEVPLVQ